MELAKEQSPLRPVYYPFVLIVLYRSTISLNARNGAKLAAAMPSTEHEVVSKVSNADKIISISILYSDFGQCFFRILHASSR
jgi:hypothetical protein